MSSTMAKVKLLPANGGRAFALLGHTLSFKAEPEDTDDALLLFEHRMPPTLSVPAHSELNNEAFYVLEGTLEVEADGERYRLGPGEFLSLRPGVVHSLHNPGLGMVRTLTLVTPASSPPWASPSTIRVTRRRPASLRTSSGWRLSAANAGLSFYHRLSPTMESKLSA
jgi:quercetin dioxygenase-like cupin family protein